MTAPKPRPLYVIAREINASWPTVYFAAVPYVAAMVNLSTVNDMYMSESGRDIVNRFLVNAGTWRGETARRVKAELRAMTAR
jgi:hypothetical protein